MKERNTKQKKIVMQVIQEAEAPLTVHEILSCGQKILPTLSIATVYREINRLCEANALHTVRIQDDPLRYEIDKHHHHHFKCTACDKVYELEGCLGSLKNIVPQGFKLSGHDLTLYGQCEICVR